MTKEDTLKNNYSKKCINWQRAYEINPSFIKSIHESMEEYAKQEAIEFAKWISNHELDFQTGHEWIGLNMKNISSEELYNLYLQSKQ